MLYIKRNPIPHLVTLGHRSQYLGLVMVMLLMAGEFSGQQTTPVKSQNVPQTDEKALNGSTINFPNNGKLLLLVIGFTHKSDKQCDGWNQKLKPTYSHNPQVAYYEMADFQGVPSFVMWMISHGLHRKIPKDEQSYFVPFFHHELEWKKLTNYSAPEDAYLVIAAPDGRVVWQTHGPQRMQDMQRCSMQSKIQPSRTEVAKWRGKLREIYHPHRLFAWGVLGSTAGGLPFLLTHPVVFRSN